VDPSELEPRLAELAKTDPQKAEAVKKKAEAGTGIVAAPPKDVLLKPSVFNTTTPPTLGRSGRPRRSSGSRGRCST
jgi:hypothetical protein